MTQGQKERSQEECSPRRVKSRSNSTSKFFIFSMWRANDSRSFDEEGGEGDNRSSSSHIDKSTGEHEYCHYHQEVHSSRSPIDRAFSLFQISNIVSS